MVKNMISQPSSPFWVERVCEQCQGRFPARVSNIKRGKAKHCSRPCLHRSMCKHEPVEFDGDVFVINSYGYYESKRTGRRLNRVIWEIHNGPVPEGYKVYFKDGVRSNYAIENLYLRKLKPRPFCKTEGCERKVYDRGLCQPHVRELRAKEKEG
jgi:hypothetical protein